jgi:hypothetical protein
VDHSVLLAQNLIILCPLSVLGGFAQGAGPQKTAEDAEGAEDCSDGNTSMHETLTSRKIGCSPAG